MSRLFTCLLFAAAMLTAGAYDYKVGDLCYDINEDGNTVSVAPEKSNGGYNSLSGVVTIPRPDYLYPTLGVKVTGPNGNHIYIPANVGHWTSTARSTSDNNYDAYYVGFRVNGNQVTIEKSVRGASGTYLIRPVCSQ